MSQGPARNTFSPLRSVRGLLSFAAVGVGLSALTLTTGRGVPCPWRALTGTLCPLCGGTSLGMALMRGDLAGAWAANQFVLVSLGVLTVLGALWTVEAAGGPAVRPPQRLRFRAAGWWAIVGVIAAGFALWRNLLAG